METRISLPIKIFMPSGRVYHDVAHLVDGVWHHDAGRGDAVRFNDDAAEPKVWGWVREDA